MLHLSFPERTSGRITDGSGLVLLAPRTSEAGFLERQPLGRTDPWVVNAPYAMHKVLDRVDLAGAAAIVVVRFEAGELRAVDFSLADDGPTTHDWRDWSEANERARVEKQDQLLATAYGPPPYNFCWGTIASSYDRSKRW